MKQVSNINDLLKVITHCYVMASESMKAQGLDPIACDRVSQKLATNIKEDDYQDYSYVEAKVIKMIKTYTGKVERLTEKVQTEDNRYFREQLTKDAYILNLLTQGKLVLDDWFDTRQPSEEVMLVGYEVESLTVTAPSPTEGQTRGDFEDNGPLFKR